MPGPKRKSLIIAFVVAVVLALPAAVLITIAKKREKLEKVSALPHSVFLTCSGKPFVLTDPRSGKYSRQILNFFSPDCEHCQYMTRSYLRCRDKLSTTQILMITIADSASVAKFKCDYHLDSMPNIILLRDTAFECTRTFGITVIPSFFIYEDQKLAKKIVGETKIENLFPDEKNL